MTYDELDVLEDKAWRAFIQVFVEVGIDRNTLTSSLDAKDCFNDVSVALQNVVDLEYSE